MGSVVVCDRLFNGCCPRRKSSREEDDDDYAERQEEGPRRVAQNEDEERMKIVLELYRHLGKKKTHSWRAKTVSSIVAPDVNKVLLDWVIPLISDRVKEALLAEGWFKLDSSWQLVECSQNLPYLMSYPRPEAKRMNEVNETQWLFNVVREDSEQTYLKLVMCKLGGDVFLSKQRLQRGNDTLYTLMYGVPIRDAVGRVHSVDGRFYQVERDFYEDLKIY